jgi:hypothetical protein
MRDLEFFNVMLDHFSPEDSQKMLTWTQGRYPATISDLDVWAPTVVAYGVMERKHPVFAITINDVHSFSF